MNTRFFLASFLALLSAAFLNGCGGGQSETEAEIPTEVAVQTGKVTRATLRAWLDAYGTVEGAPAGHGQPAGTSRLSPTAPGTVLAVPVQEGERVEARTVLVKLDDRAALAQLRLAEQQMERQNLLKKTGGTSEKAVQEAAQQLAAAQAQLALVELTTPISGIVARINAQPGQTVDANTIVAEVVDPARLVVTVNAPVTEAVRLKAGQPAELLREPATKVAPQGQVLFVSPQVDSKTATVMVRVSVPADAGLSAGQFVHVRIITEERGGVLAVPREAVYTDHDGQSTLSIVNGDMAKQSFVKTGLRDGELVEVAGDGVTEGATVVTIGSYALPKETKVKVIAK